jgi:hypothetical protein
MDDRVTVRTFQTVEQQAFFPFFSLSVYLVVLVLLSLGQTSFEFMNHSQFISWLVFFCLLSTATKSDLNLNDDVED